MIQYAWTNQTAETRINIKNGLDELNAKAKAWDKYLESTVRQEAIEEFGEDDPRLDYAVELTERLYREDE